MILVVGGSGFIGSAVVRELVRRGRPVRVLTTNAARAARRFQDVDVEVVEGDVTRPETLLPAVRGATAVVYTVTFHGFPVEQPRKGLTFENLDRRGAENVLRAAGEAGVGQYVYVSGAGAAPDAPKHWFRVKWAAEMAIQNSGIPYSIFRPSWVYGPEDQALNRFVGFARRLPFLPVIGSGEQRLQPVFVNDVAWAIAASLEQENARHKTFEIGGPEVMTMNSLLQILLEVMGKRRPLLHVPVSLVKLVAFFLQFLPNPPLSPQAIDFATGDALTDNRMLLETFNIRLTPFRDGIASYLASLRAGAAT